MNTNPPNLIKLAGVCQKDTQRTILKKLRQYDLQFCNNCELEIKICLDRHYLPFDEFSKWLNETYLRYLIRNVYIYSLNPDAECTDMIEYILTQSMQQLRKVTPELSNPLGLLHELFSTAWGSAYRMIQDYRPDLTLSSCASFREIDFNKPVKLKQLLKDHDWLAKQRADMLNFKYPFEDKPLYPDLQLFYLAWLQAVLAWETPADLLKSLYEEVTGKQN